MEYLIIYNDTEVLSCERYVPGTAIALGANMRMLTATAINAKTMLDAAGVDYSNMPELVNM